MLLCFEFFNVLRNIKFLLFDCFLFVLNIIRKVFNSYLDYIKFKIFVERLVYLNVKEIL